MTTVVIVDDHPIVRAGMRSILQSAADIQIIGEGANGADAPDWRATCTTALFSP